MKTIFLSILLLFFVLLNPAQALDFSKLPNQFVEQCKKYEPKVGWGVHEDVMCINGDINYSMMFGFEINFVPRKISWIILNSPGGLVMVSKGISHLMKSRKINVIIPSWGECHSACVALLNAGYEQIVHEGAEVSVHMNHLKPEGNRVILLIEDTKKFFQEYLGASPDLFNRYLDFLISKKLLNPVEKDWKVTMKVHVHNGKIWVNEALMPLTVDELKEYGIIK